MMWQMAGCCSGRDAEVTRVAIDDRGFTVGIVGLKQVFEQLSTMGRKPEAGVRDELLAMVKTRNYVPPSAEERYNICRIAYQGQDHRVEHGGKT